MTVSQQPRGGYGARERLSDKGCLPVLSWGGAGGEDIAGAGSWMRLSGALLDARAGVAQRCGGAWGELARVTRKGEFPVIAGEWAG